MDQIRAGNAFEISKKRDRKMETKIRLKIQANDL